MAVREPRHLEFRTSPGTSCSKLPPSVEMRWIFQGPPDFDPLKTMLLPFGDQRGRSARRSLDVSWTRCSPFAWLLFLACRPAISPHGDRGDHRQRQPVPGVKRIEPDFAFLWRTKLIRIRIQQFPVSVRLKLRSKANGIAALRSYRIAGEQTSKIDHVDAVVEIRPVHLKGQLQFFPSDQLSSERSIN